MRSYPLYIDGRDDPGQGWTYTVRTSAFIDDPAETFGLKRRLELEGDRAFGDDEPTAIGRCAWGDDAENRRAVDAAARASREFGRFAPRARRQIAEDFHDTVIAASDEFVEILVAEGHPRRLAEWEIKGILANCCPPTLDWVFAQLHQEYEDAEGRRVRLTRKPDGVVCVNPPQNAAGVMSVMGVGALFAGNAVVIKAPRSTPLGVMFAYREIVAPVLERHGAPPGTLNVVSGDTRRTLRQWLSHPGVDDVFFVGDSTVGLKLGAQCVARGKKPILELSGNDPLVVWRDADLEGAAEALCESFYGSAQICMVPKQAIVHPAIAAEFVELFLDRVATIRPGYPEDPATLLSPVLKADRFLEFLAEARDAGAELLTGGRRVGLDGAPSESGLFFEPSVVRVDGLEDAARLRCVREETFFPLVPIVVPEDAPDHLLLERVIEFVNADEYGLRTSLWATEPRVVEEFTAGVWSSGTLRVNESHMGFSPPMATHGGTGRSGGPFGGLNFPALSTSHLQGISIAPVRAPLPARETEDAAGAVPAAA
ncbi:MAG: aldehyde dehydrogenase [Actinobacteria bacterium]|nr:MAG: aldehyde dehydrogenase [Actinomycetota bacterium]